MADVKTHDNRTAMKSRRAIKGAAPGRRVGFAIGMFGSTAVMLARRGKPASLVAELKTMAPPEAAPASDRKLSFKVATSGLLFRVGDELVLQCREKPDATKILKARKYFKLLKAGTPWSKVRLTRLGEGDEGDPAAEGDAETQDDALHDGALDADDDEAEEQIVNEWDDDASEPSIDVAPPYQDGEAPPPYPADEPAPPYAREASPSPDAADEPPPPYPGNGNAEPSGPERAAEASRIVRLVDIMAPNLQRGGGVSREALEGTIADLLRFISPDRLLLALCSASNMEHLAATARDRAADGEEPGEESVPLANDDAGRDRISQAFAALGETVGRERGLVATGERAAAGASILRMVGQFWARSPQSGPEEVIVKLAALLDSTFRRLDAKELRRMLGLPAAVPGADADGIADPGAPWRKHLSDARGGWAAAVPDAVASFAGIKDAIRRSYGEQEDVAAPFAMLDAVAARLEGDLADRLDGLLGETDRSGLAARRQAVAQSVADMRTFLETDDVASSLDDNEFVEGTAFIGALLGHLDRIQASLDQAAA